VPLPVCGRGNVASSNKKLGSSHSDLGKGGGAARARRLERRSATPIKPSCTLCGRGRGPSGEARAGHFSNAVKLRQMEAVDGADLFGWHSSTVVLEDGEEEEGPFDELDHAV